MSINRDKSAWLYQASMPVTYARLYLDVAHKRGVASSEILRMADISPQVLQNPLGKLSAVEFTRLVLMTLTLAGNEGVGFEVGLQQPLTSHGSLGLALMCCPSGADAAQLVQRFWYIRGRGVALHYHEGENYLVFEVQPEMPIPSVILQTLYESILTSFYRGIQSVVGDAAQQAMLYFAHNQPAYADRFAHVLPIVRYQQNMNALLLPKTFLQQSVATANSETFALALAQCERELILLGESADNFLSVAKASIHLTAQGYPSPEQLAEQLHVSTRTLRRRLQAQGSSYQQLLDDVRRRDALLLLANAALSIQQVAELLGYTDPANFTRAFKQWTHQTPSQYRALQQAATRPAYK